MTSYPRPVMRSHRSVLLFTLLCSVVGAASGGCAQVLGVEETSLGGAGAGGSSGLTLPALCTGSESPKEESVNINMTTVTFTTQKPVQGISVRAFRTPTDFATFSTTVACGLSDADGQVTVAVPKGSSGFNGFLSVRGTDQESFFYFFSPPLTSDESFGFLCVSNADWAGLRGALGVPDLASTHGQVTVNTLTSDGKPLPGMTLEIDGADENTKGFYFTDTGQPSTTQTKTSSLGFGGFFNVPAAGGVKGVRMKDQDGNIVGSVDIYVYPGTWSTMRLKPAAPVP